jgi:hypothetical protein
MYVIDIQARIGGKRFFRINSLSVESSLTQIGTKAELTLPTTARLTRAGEFVSEVETAKAFQVGDEVEVLAGYDGDLRTEFRGYVRRVSPTIPLKLELEDGVYLLRRKNVKRSWRSVTLAEVITFLLEDTGIEVVGEIPGITFSPFYLKNVTAAYALQKLRDRYALTIYFRLDGKLYVGLIGGTDRVRVKYRVGRNVVDHRLEWQSKDDVRLRVKAILIRRDGSRLEEEIGSPDGELRTLHFYDLADGQTLKQRAEEELLKFQRDGYSGSLTGWLVPECRIGNTVDLADETWENNREGDYLAEGVTTTIDSGGARRRVKLGLKLN